MGATGSYTSKVQIIEQLHPFTQFHRKEMDACWTRGIVDLSETFALRLHEFEFLLNSKLVGLATCRYLFHEKIDTDRNQLVDKFETMCLLCLASALSNAEKVELFFDLFNFNDKGYLVESEISLLIQTVTRIVYKMDNKWPVPHVTVWKHLVYLSLKHFAVIDSTGMSLRKPELVKFAAETQEVQRYLDAWRGHASQVLVAKDDSFWKDTFFPCNEGAILPFRDWLKKGLPPSHFIRWRRLKNIGSVIEYKAYPNLFTHVVSTLRTIDKKKLYHGQGALGNGYIIQQMLADRWLLNGVAAAVSRAQCLLHLFGITGQEVIGRYDVRIFEGEGWRSIFVDDRMPTSPQCTPIFSVTSDKKESWLLVLEKGIAKYMGSYGNLSLASERFDAFLYSIRMLTGGHVIRTCTYDYEWQSSTVDNKEGSYDGYAYMEQLLDEGSIVMLGRSESMTFHSNTTKASPSVAPPHGYLYAVVSIYTREDGYKFVNLRDSFNDFMTQFGQVVNTNPDYATPNDDRKYVDERSGYCRIVTIPLEQVKEHFDTIIVSKYPDSLRSHCHYLNFRQWRSDIVKQKTTSKYSPAHFLLKVKGHPLPNPDAPPPPPETRLSKLRDKMAREMQVNDDIVAQDMDMAFDYQRRRYFPNSSKPASLREDKEYLAALEDMTLLVPRVGIPIEDEDGYSRSTAPSQQKSTGEGKKDADDQEDKEEAVEGDQVLGQEEEEEVKLRWERPFMSDSEKIRHLEELTPVDFAVTVSSAIPWAVAGGKEAGPKLRFRVVPTIATVKYLRGLHEQLAVIKKEKEILKQENEEKMKALLAIDEDNDEESRPQSADGGEEKDTVDEGEEKDTVDEESDSDEESDEESSSGSDETDEDGEEETGSLDSQGNPKMRKKKKTKDKTPSELAAEEWAKLTDEERLEREIKDREKVLTEQWFEVRDSSETSWLSKTLQLHSGEYYIVVDIDFEMPSTQLYNLAKPKDISEAPWLEGRKVELNKIWCHVSSIGRYEISKVKKENVEMHARTLQYVSMKPPRWPFMGEKQEEVSSRFLNQYVKTLRKQVDSEGTKFMTMTRAFMLKYKTRLMGLRERKKAEEREKQREKELEEEREREKLRLRAEYEAQLQAEKEYDAMQKQLKLEETRKKKAARAGKK